MQKIEGWKSRGVVVRQVEQTNKQTASHIKPHRHPVRRGGGGRGGRQNHLGRTRCEWAWPERELRGEKFFFSFLLLLVRWLQDLKTHHFLYECLRETTPKLSQTQNLNDVVLDFNTFFFFFWFVFWRGMVKKHIWDRDHDKYIYIENNEW